MVGLIVKIDSQLFAGMKSGGLPFFGEGGAFCLIRTWGRNDFLTEDSVKSVDSRVG